MTKTIPVILAGGSGTRLWPLSRAAYPKQCLPLVKENETLLQSTVLRVADFPEMLAPIIVCHEDHRFIIAEQLRQIHIQPLAIILESKARNTAPAIALAAYFVKQHYPATQLFVMPADHIINDNQRLFEAFRSAHAAIEANRLVAFGVVAQRPETGYGYIKIAQPIVADAVYHIEQFVEKPNREQAMRFVAAGNYYWNCGIFAFRAATYLQELNRYEPYIAQCCERAMKTATEDSDFIRPTAQALASCPSNSFDYAVMEKTHYNAMTVLRSAWNDIGSWSALMQEQSSDIHGNVKIGDVIIRDVKGSYLRSEDRLLAAAGVTDHVVVVTRDAVLVAHKDHCQDVKHLVADFQSQHREEAIVHLKVHRPWGSYQT